MEWFNTVSNLVTHNTETVISSTNSIRGKFIDTYTFEQRYNETYRIRQSYPDRVPIICEKSLNQDLPNIDKNKYLVPVDLTVGQFLFVIKRRIKLRHEEALYLFINGTIPPTSELIGTTYEKHKNNDGFLYITYAKENTFGFDN